MVLAFCRCGVALPFRLCLCVGRLIAHRNPDPLPLAASLSTLSLRHRCPRCGEGHLFDGLLRIKQQCDVCQLDLEQEDAGDGPAFFVITIMGALIVLLPALLELTIPLPFWAHALIWIPFMIGGSLWLLRVFKSGLIALQYRHHLFAQSPMREEEKYDA